MADAPGPAPDRAAAEQRLRIAKGTLRALTSYRGAPDFREDVEIVLAELDRLRALIAAVLAACSEAEAVAGWNTARVTVAEIRTLLEGEGQ